MYRNLYASTTESNGAFVTTMKSLWDKLTMLSSSVLFTGSCKNMLTKVLFVLYSII